jgi:uncharacterized protein YbbK (DUF523 family)
MLLAHHPHLIDALRAPTPEDPWRVLVSGCIAGWGCGVDGTDYGMGLTLHDLLSLPTARTLPFCPEQHALGTPRTMPDIHGGDGADVVAGRAKVLDEHGEDLTEKMLEGARAMVAFAQAQGAELALLTDMSAACGSQVISDGCRFDAARRYQRGVGVATALLIGAGIPVISQRDHRSIARLRARMDASYTPPADAYDHHEHPWVRENLPAPHPRA